MGRVGPWAGYRTWWGLPWGTVGQGYHWASWEAQLKYSGGGSLSRVCPLVPKAENSKIVPSYASMSKVA